MRYTKNITTKVLRTEHKITLSIGGMADTLLYYVKIIPPTAKLVDISDDENDNVVLVFLEERKEDDNMANIAQ
jgi:hypothetical protein